MTTPLSGHVTANLDANSSNRAVWERASGARWFAIRARCFKMEGMRWLWLVVCFGALGCDESFVAPASPDLYKVPYDLGLARFEHDAGMSKDMSVMAMMDLSEADLLPPPPEVDLR
jgi:hypothetical protein